MIMLFIFNIGFFDVITKHDINVSLVLELCQNIKVANKTPCEQLTFERCSCGKVVSFINNKTTN